MVMANASARLQSTAAVPDRSFSIATAVSSRGRCAKHPTEPDDTTATRSEEGGDDGEKKGRGK